MKKTIVILACTLALWSCQKSNTPNIMFYDGAAIVKNLEVARSVLTVLNDIILVAPALTDTNLQIGDLLWVNLFIDNDKQISEDTLFVSEIAFLKVRHSLIVPTEYGQFANGATHPIYEAIMWPDNAGNFWIFGFVQTAPQGQIFDYEMVFEKKDDELHPTVYIRSRKANNVSGVNRTITSYYGFDLTNLIEEHANKESKTLSFHVKFLLGLDIEKGEEVFSSFRPSLVTVNIK